MRISNRYDLSPKMSSGMTFHLDEIFIQFYCGDLSGFTLMQRCKGRCWFLFSVHGKGDNAGSVSPTINITGII